MKDEPSRNISMYTKPPYTTPPAQPAPVQDEPFTYYRHYDGGTQDWPDEKTIPLYTAPPAELRRLHSVNADLLEALQLCEGNISSLLASAHPKVYGEWLTVVEAAIAKATGETK